MNFDALAFDVFIYGSIIAIVLMCLVRIVFEDELP